MPGGQSTGTHTAWTEYIHRNPMSFHESTTNNLPDTFAARPSDCQTSRFLQSAPRAKRDKLILQSLFADCSLASAVNYCTTLHMHAQFCPYTRLALKQHMLRFDKGLHTVRIGQRANMTDNRLLAAPVFCAHRRFSNTQQVTTPRFPSSG